MFEVVTPFHREFMYRVWRCLESKNHPGASIVADKTTGAGVDAIGNSPDSFFVGGECPSLEVHPGEVLAVPRRGGGFPVILVSSAVQNWLENNGGKDAILGVWWDSRTDNVILDRSTDVSGLSNALALGRVRGESDIWDVANGCCVPVSG